MVVSPWSSPVTLKLLACGLSITVAAGCGIDDTHVKLAHRKADSSAPTSSAGASSSAQERAGESAVAPLKPDQDFLHRMSDHHKGVIILTHEAIQRSEELPVKDEARSLDRQYDAALREMQTLLREEFQDYYEPKLTTEYGAALEGLGNRNGKEFVAEFRRQLKDSHQQALDLIDAYLPKISRQAIRASALHMRAEEHHALSSER